MTYTPPPASFFPFIPGNPLIPVQQSVAVSGDTGPAGTTVGCTAGYERVYYNDCHSSIFGDYCLDISDWTPAGTETAVRTFKIDTTDPYNVVVHATSAPNANGWYNSPVTFTVSGSDDASGIHHCGFGNFNSWPTPSITVNSSTFSNGSGAGCLDVAGNGTGTGVSWRYDNTLPALAPTVTPTGVLLLGSAATADSHATDTFSGIDAANTGCDTVDTSIVGSFTVDCHATDRAGNTNTANAGYIVGYGYTFLSPQPNSVSSGSLGIKFRLTNANGQSIADSEALSLVDSDCKIQVSFVNGGALNSCPTYNTSQDRFQLDVKPTKAQKGENGIWVTVTLGSTVVLTTDVVPITIK